MSRGDHPEGHINRSRYRTLLVSLVMSCVLSLSAVPIALRRPGASLSEWAVFVLAGLVFAAMFPLAIIANRRGDRAALERIGLVVLLVGALALIQRMVWAMFGSYLADPTANPFRPVYQYLPFLFIAAIALMRAERALVVCWITWGLVAVITLIGLHRADGWSLQRDGAMPLLIWVLVGNPLFILMLHGLPHYERALERSAAEITRMRERTELADKLMVSEQRFNLVVESLQVGVWDRWLGPPEVRWWSPRFYELIGYTPEQLPASEENLRSLLHPEDRERVWAQGTDQLRQGTIMDVNFRLNTAHRGYRWFNSHGKAVRDAKGRILRLAGAINDIHDQRIAGQALHEAQAELTRLAYHDTLTELHNRRAFDERCAAEWGRSRRNGTALSLLLIDLDYFKLFNDCYGHTAGDQCLRRVALCIAECVRRPGDFPARLGGEEFAVLLPETPATGAEHEAHAIHQAIRAMAIRHDTSPIGIVTGSIGIATDEPEIRSPADLFERADRALYQVKNRGRDGVLHARLALGELGERGEIGRGA
jgi:diguanylate cyclase (GGDEF)-like protein/PAS domain S-box-containing protein